MWLLVRWVTPDLYLLVKQHVVVKRSWASLIEVTNFHTSFAVPNPLFIDDDKFQLLDRLTALSIIPSGDLRKVGTI